MRIDAHNHLHDARLAPWREQIVAALGEIGLGAAVVNGTREDDWDAVATLAKQFPWVLPSFGLHPWHVNAARTQWREHLLEMVSLHPGCGIGEIGLDRWIDGHDLAVQMDCFRWQLALAARENLPASIHCLRAWGAMWDTISAQPVPERGFLLHAFGGPREMVDGFVRRGAYFSFSPYFLHARKATQREIFRAIPRDRILVETDAPDMAPPAEANARPLSDNSGVALNHPANLDLAYAAIAELREWSREETEAQVEENFLRWFGQPR
jgi:TatD DNase family protein